MDRNMTTAEQSEQTTSLALLVIPPMQERSDPIALEAFMQSLILDERHPLALELAGSAQNRRFIVRATTLPALDHVEALLRSHYPQIEIRPLCDYEDPLHLEPHEAISAIELTAGGATYLPLRTWQQTKEEQEGVDPILGLLSALSKLPEQTRAVAQVALLPAPATWSQGDLRKSIENPLEPERRADQIATRHDMMMLRYDQQFSFATPLILTAGGLIGVVSLLSPWLPAWVRNIPMTLLSGQDPHLTSWQITQLVLGILGLALVAILLALLVGRILGWLNARPLYDTRQVAQKTSRMAYRVRLRLYVISPQDSPVEALDGPIPLLKRLVGLLQQVRGQRTQDETRQEVLLRLIAAYRQFHLASGAYFIPKPIHNGSDLLAYDARKRSYGWSKDLRHSQHLISVDALAALWHMPDASVLPELALVEHRRARTLLIPPGLAQQSAGLPPIGYSEHGGYRLPFALTPQFFTLHTLIAGKSGEGKSTCIEHVAQHAMRHGGLVLIDPHGDLVEHVLPLVPSEREDDVVLIDLSDKQASVGLNPLDVTLGRERDKAISDLLKTFSHIWATSWGPRMENAFEMALRTLFEANKLLVSQDAYNGPRLQYTLLDVLPVLTNDQFCHSLLQQIDDDYLYRWWRDYYDPLSLFQQRDIINPIITKVTKFESQIARRIIGQSAATINFTQMIEERKIILIKLAKGVIGADVAAILGATLLGLLQVTLEEQGNKEISERVRFPIILDEFQVLAGIDYGALAELRKYGATFFLATQSLEYLQKLDPILLPTVLANVKQLLIFHVSAQDSETLHKELGVEPEDILNLDLHTCYVKLASGTRRQPTFSLRISPPPVGNRDLAESVRTRCRVRYTCSIETVDEMLREAMLRNIRQSPTMPPGSHSRSRKHARAASNSNAGSQEPIILPAVSNHYIFSPDDDTSPQHAAAPASSSADPDADQASPRTRGTRGRRSSKRGVTERDSERPGAATPMAFGEGFVDEERPADEIEVL